MTSQEERNELARQVLSDVGIVRENYWGDKASQVMHECRRRKTTKENPGKMCSAAGEKCIYTASCKGHLERHLNYRGNSECGEINGNQPEIFPDFRLKTD